MNRIIERIRDILYIHCEKCKAGRIRHIGSDWTGRVWIEVYECDNCKTQFI